MRAQPFLFAPLLFALAQPAAALTCGPPDMFLALEDAQASPEPNFVFVGSLTQLDTPPLANGDRPMRLTGIELTANGVPVDMEAMGRVSCSDESCGEVVNVAKGVFFGTIDSDVGPLVFTFGACNNTVFDNPHPEAVADLGDTIQRIQGAAMEQKAADDLRLDGVEGNGDATQDHGTTPEGMGVDGPVASSPHMLPKAGAGTPTTP